MILNILAVALGIAAIIGIHEACHMLVSKLFGVKVLKFSLGFGPVIFSKKIGDTSYELAALPLGGYVQCHGENADQKVKRGFFSLPWWKRSLIALAGPIANLILGFLLIFGILITFKEWPLLQGLQRAYQISSWVVIETLKWVFGIFLPIPKDAIAQAASAQGSGGLAGPIMVTKMLISSTKEGASTFLFMLSLISLSLGLFNLFPIPGLDGGHIFLYTLEGIRGKKFSQKVYILWSYIGFVLLITLMLFTCLMDLNHLFGK
jgi:regulator of sigma E protease